MFILDTNVLSAVMGSRPVAVVAAWVVAQPEEQLFTTTICEAEILAGIMIMPEGRRRHGLQAAAATIFTEVFRGRILPFDEPAAAIYAGLYAARRRAGRPATTADLMIARAHGAEVVTRDTGGFEGCDLTLINPWHAG
jgi:toxin FitB